MLKEARSWVFGPNSIYGKTVGGIGKGWNYFWKNYQISPKQSVPGDYLLPIVGLGVVFIIATKWKPR